MPRVLLTNLPGEGGKCSVKKNRLCLLQCYIFLFKPGCKAISYITTSIPFPAKRGKDSNWFVEHQPDAIDPCYSCKLSIKSWSVLVCLLSQVIFILFSLLTQKYPNGVALPSSEATWVLILDILMGRHFGCYLVWERIFACLFDVHSIFWTAIPLILYSCWADIAYSWQFGVIVPLCSWEYSTYILPSDGSSNHSNFSPSSNTPYWLFDASTFLYPNLTLSSISSIF